MIFVSISWFQFRLLSGQKALSNMLMNPLYI
jgi:hypothetical protein